MTSWIRYAGRIMPCGDSITVGETALIGGWRAILQTTLNAQNLAPVYVGSSSDGYGSYVGGSGTTAQGFAAGLSGLCTTYIPRVVILGWGANDIGGDGVDATTCLSRLSTCISGARSGAPQAIVLQQTLVVPQNGGTYPAYYAARATFEEVNAALPALCRSLGAELVDIGAPATSDGLHPTGAGYTSVAAAISSALLRVLP